MIIGVVIIVIIVAAGCLGYYYQTSQQKPRPLNVVTIESNSEFVTLDPSIEFSQSIMILSNVYETMITYVPWDAQPFQPSLATSWESSNNSQTWVFHLRQGVMFHDGTPFNATAVKYSIERTIRASPPDRMRQDLFRPGGIASFLGSQTQSAWTG